MKEPFNPALLKEGDCLLYKPSGIFGWIISIKTWHAIGHCEGFLGTDLIGRRWSVASRDGLGVNTYELRTKDLALVLRPIQPFDQTAALAWFRSPLARRVVALEREALEPARASEFEVFAAGLVANRPSEWRLSLLARLDAAGLATETSLDLALAVLGSLARARDPQAPPARIAQGLLELRDRMSWRVRQATLLGMLFAYRGLADEELERLVGFVESDAGQWFVNATSEVIVGGLAAAAGTRER